MIIAISAVTCGKKRLLVMIKQKWSAKLRFLSFFLLFWLIFGEIIVSLRGQIRE
jgi:hypothetical protein